VLEDVVGLKSINELGECGVPLHNRLRDPRPVENGREIREHDSRCLQPVIFQLFIVRVASVKPLRPDPLRFNGAKRLGDADGS